MKLYSLEMVNDFGETKCCAMSQEMRSIGDKVRVPVYRQEVTGYGRTPVISSIITYTVTACVEQ